jgi:hypothetical protein
MGNLLCALARRVAGDRHLYRSLPNSVSQIVL